MVELCSTQMTETDLDTTIIDGLSFTGWTVGGIEVEATMLGQVQNQVFIFYSNSRSCNAWPGTKSGFHFLFQYYFRFLLLLLLLLKSLYLVD